VKKHKISANRKVAYALKIGELIKPGKCEHCGINSIKLHGHHPDYNKPLETIWLCPKCHKGEHKKEYLPIGGNPLPPHPFWDDLDLSISLMVQELLDGQVIDELVDKLKDAGVQRISSSLLYKWANPNAEQAPSLKQFLLLVKICENCGPIESINEACGKVGVPDDDFLAGVKFYAAEFEKRGRART
jgi:hypothetical protein